jgi:hypothetical protein
LHRDYVGVTEKRLVHEQVEERGISRGKPKKSTKKEVRTNAKEIERAIDKA